MKNPPGQTTHINKPMAEHTMSTTVKTMFGELISYSFQLNTARPMHLTTASLY